MGESSCIVQKVIDGIRRSLEILCGFLMILISIIVFAQVFNRYILKGTFAWAEEAAVYMMLWMVFLGASINILHGSNIQIDFFIRLLPDRVQKLLDAACQVICIVFTWILCQKSFQILKLNAHNLAPGIKIPISVMYASLTISAILMIVFFGCRTVVDLKFVFRKDGAEG